MVYKYLKNRLLLCFLSLLFADSAFSEKAELVAPPYNITNRHNVNMFSGSVQINHSGVSIGGGMGLSHSISMHSNEWVGYENNAWGPVDQYQGKLYRILETPNTFAQGYFITVSDGTTTQYFNPGEDLEHAVPNSEGFFPSVGDPRYKLRYEPGIGMVMTKPDGTKVIYGSNQPSYTFNHTYDMTEIRRPNGMIIKINPHRVRKIASVTSNTGFQLKYYYVDNSTPMSAALQAATNDREIDLGDNAARSLEWSRLTPRYVKGINNAVEYCAATSGVLTAAGECSGNSWPTAEYIWPNGMPRRMYVAEGTFSVKNPNGVQTDYIHEPIDKAIMSGQGWVPHDPGLYKLPRLVRIKDAQTGAVLMNYSYENAGEVALPTDQFNAYFMPTQYAALKKSWVNINDDNLGYGFIKRFYNGALGEMYHVGGGYQSITKVVLNPTTSAPLSIDSWNQSVSLNGYRNTLVNSYFDKITSTSSTFEYDNRGNVTASTTAGATQRAEYPASCDANNEKYCNNPTWIADAKGNRTDYTYHAESGQIATVTLPANRHGIRAQTRYKYEQKYAKYFTSPNVKTTSSTPIWLKTEERYCTNSAATTGGSCTGTDEVVTSFEYLHDNLLMTGISVYSQKENKTLRTCYQHDIYGNRIGETQPKANLASCD